VKERLEATNATSYLEKIFSLSELRESPRCYRGHADGSWALKPSIMRNVQQDAENRIFSELMLEAPAEFASDRSMFDKLVRAQHYGLPTRLLDVSLNPLVGLYFACNEKEYDSLDGVVKVFDFVPGRVKFADSDAVSLICNLARRSDSERESLLDKQGEVQVAAEKAKFRKMPAVKRLIQFVRIEKSYFLNQVEPTDLFRYYFVYPIKNNRRVIAQSGAFIAAGLLRFSALERSTSFTLHQIHIPAACKDHIRRELDTMNINSRTMFPEIEFTSEYIRDKWTVHSPAAAAALKR
jgi:hypothetical protein